MARKPIFLREECKDIQHYVCMSHKMEAIKAITDETCKVYIVNQPTPLIVHHSAKELSIEAFGHAIYYRTRRTAPPERIYINKKLVANIQFLKTGTETANAEKGQRSITIVMDSGRTFSVIENVSVAIRSLFNSSAVSFTMPFNKILKDNSDEDPY